MVKISDMETAEDYGVEDLPTVVYFENGIPFVYMGNFLWYTYFYKKIPHIFGSMGAEFHSEADKLNSYLEIPAKRVLLVIIKSNLKLLKGNTEIFISAICMILFILKHFIQISKNTPNFD